MDSPSAAPGAGLIEHMVQRFLGWRLPENFNPDEGIHFDADAAKKLDPRNHRYEPVGTNLFDYDQATEMVRHMLEGAPTATNRGRSPGGAHNGMKTHCNKGHPYSDENTYRRPNGRGRSCIICRKAEQENRRLKRANP